MPDSQTFVYLPHLRLQRYVSRLPPLLLNGLKFQAPFSDLLQEAGAILRGLPVSL